MVRRASCTVTLAPGQRGQAQTDTANLGNPPDPVKQYPKNTYVPTWFILRREFVPENALGFVCGGMQSQPWRRFSSRRGWFAQVVLDEAIAIRHQEGLRIEERLSDVAYL